AHGESAVDRRPSVYDLLPVLRKVYATHVPKPEIRPQEPEWPGGASRELVGLCPAVCRRNSVHRDHHRPGPPAHPAQRRTRVQVHPLPTTGHDRLPAGSPEPRRRPPPRGGHQGPVAPGEGNPDRAHYPKRPTPMTAKLWGMPLVVALAGCQPRAAPVAEPEPSPQPPATSSLPGVRVSPA